MQGPQVEPTPDMLEAAARERRRKERQMRLSVIVSIREIRKSCHVSDRIKHFFFLFNQI